jgi:predicted deacetylase
MHATVSIHDVMPHTLDGIHALAELIPDRHKSKVLLLVVPGVEWSTVQIDQLKQLCDAGFPLAGHGWQHRTPYIRSLYHRLHSLLVSRQVAEHLSYSREELNDLLQRNYEWFTDKKLPFPETYVPPAWAMGKLTHKDLKALPFRYYEDTQGLYDSTTDSYKRLPLAGFEADTRLREYFLRPWNSLNNWLASPTKPLRISLHPYDLDYRLGKQLRHFMEEIDNWYSVSDVFRT